MIAAKYAARHRGEYYDQAGRTKGPSGPSPNALAPPVIAAKYGPYERRVYAVVRAALPGMRTFSRGVPRETMRRGPDHRPPREAPCPVTSSSPTRRSPARSC